MTPILQREKGPMEAAFAQDKMSLETLLGDCCLSSGVITYLGQHDQ